jgi:hemolysin III
MSLPPRATTGLSADILYLSSGLFHGLPFSASRQPNEFHFFQMLDQSAIFLLIAGTNTPLMAAFLKGKQRVVCLLAIWGSALVGVLSLWILPKANHSWIVAVFLVMGWIGMLPLRNYYRAVGWKAMNWMWLGCGLYSIEASPLRLDRMARATGFPVPFRLS